MKTTYLISEAYQIEDEKERQIIISQKLSGLIKSERLNGVEKYRKEENASFPSS